MDSIDILLLPVYMVLIYIIAIQIKNRNAKDPLYQRYFIRGLNYKMFGSIFFALIYLLYYKGGDSINYYLCSKPLYNLAFKSPDKFFAFVFDMSSAYPNEGWYDCWLIGVDFLLRSNTTLTVIRATSLINLFCFNSYVVDCIVVSFMSYIIIFKTFKLFVSIYPMLEKEFSVAFLMIPSAIFWGSAVGKDVMMFSGVLYFFYCFYNLVILKKNIVANVIKLALTAYLISLIRGFLIITLAPSLILMAAIYYRNALRNPVFRFLALPVFLGGGAVASYFFIQNIGHTMQSYNLDSMQKTAEGFKSWHTYLGETTGGSSYSLGDVDYTTAGIARKALLAILICLFGPFVWQIRNAVMLMSGAESILFLYYFVKVFINVKAYRALGIIFRDHIIMFCIPFVLIIAMAIGLTSFNYGALVRYKIPILPFFAVLIAVTRYRINVARND
ncbi:MAG: hypothetical protein KA149_00860 [Chitinophagales bacterium]|nr:hypothetical protein [Chitinophagales bacterium]